MALILRRRVEESTVSRLLQWMENKDAAIITAWRTYAIDFIGGEHPELQALRPAELPDNVPSEYQWCVDNNVPVIPRRTRQALNHELVGILRGYGYGVTAVRGEYVYKSSPEDTETLTDRENSYFVVNLHDDPKFKENILELGTYFNQNSIIYKPSGDETAYEIGTNGYDEPGYLKEVSLGSVERLLSDKDIDTIGGRTKIRGGSFSFIKSQEGIREPYPFSTSKEGCNEPWLGHRLSIKDLAMQYHRHRSYYYDYLRRKKT